MVVTQVEKSPWNHRLQAASPKLPVANSVQTSIGLSHLILATSTLHNQYQSVSINTKHRRCPRGPQKSACSKGAGTATTSCGATVARAVPPQTSTTRNNNAVWQLKFSFGLGVAQPRSHFHLLRRTVGPVESVT